MIPLRQLGIEQNILVRRIMLTVDDRFMIDHNNCPNLIRNAFLNHKLLYFVRRKIIVAPNKMSNFLFNLARTIEYNLA